MNNRTTFMVRPTQSWLALSLGVMALTPFVAGQQTEFIAATQPYRTLTVEEKSRPALEATKILGSRHGIVIHYEDPAYAFPGDVIDASTPAFLAVNPGKRYHIPKGGRLDVAYPDFQRVLAKGNAGLSSLEASVLLQTVVNAYEKSGLPGAFSVRQVGTAFIFLPRSIKDKYGVQQPGVSPLDVRVSFPEKERNIAELMELICKEISRSGTKVVVGTIPLGFMMNTAATVKAENEPAREVMLRALQSTHWLDRSLNHPIGRLCWRLLYDVDGSGYVLNFAGAVKEVGTPEGGERYEPVVLP